MPRPSIDRTGERHGRLLIIGRAPNAPDGAVRWACSCLCGGSVVVRYGHLVSGNTRSCGCARRAVNGRAVPKNSPQRRMLALDGECKSLSDWARQLGVTPNAVWARIERGMTVREALTTPFDGKRRKREAKRLVLCERRLRKHPLEDRSVLLDTSVELHLKHKGEVHPIAYWSEKYGKPEHVIRLLLSKEWPVADAIGAPYFEAPTT